MARIVLKNKKTMTHKNTANAIQYSSYRTATTKKNKTLRRKKRK